MKHDIDQIVNLLKNSQKIKLPELIPGRYKKGDILSVIGALKKLGCRDLMKSFGTTLEIILPSWCGDKKRFLCVCAKSFNYIIEVDCVTLKVERQLAQHAPGLIQPVASVSLSHVNTASAICSFERVKSYYNEMIYEGVTLLGIIHEFSLTGDLAEV